MKITTSLPQASLPEGVRIYAVGDIHGRDDLLCRLLDAIEDDVARSPPTSVQYVFLGDYVDRGPASRAVLDTLIDLTRNRIVHFIKGNHEAYMMRFLDNPEFLSDWGRIGGYETLVSYGVPVALGEKDRPDSAIQTALSFDKAIPAVHRVFLKALKPYFVCGDYCFVHAGIRPGVPLIYQAETDLFSIRSEFLNCTEAHENVIVHGHTPVAQPDLGSNRINIDTGAFATGRLTALRLEKSSRLCFTT